MLHFQDAYASKNGRFCWLLFIVTSLSCHCIVYRLYLLLHNLSFYLSMAPTDLVFMTIQLLHTPFFTVVPVLCETLRFLIKDFNARLKITLRSTSIQYENADKFHNLLLEYKKLSLLLEQLNEFASLYLLLLQFIIIPTIILLLYMIVSTTLPPFVLSMISWFVLELCLIAAYNIWFPAALNEEVITFRLFRNFFWFMLHF